MRALTGTGPGAATPVSPVRTAYWWQLVAAAVVSAAIYAAYVARYAFLPYSVQSTRINIFDVLGADRFGLGLYIGALTVLFASATVAWRAARLLPETRFPPVWAIVPPLFFAVLLTVAMPLQSRDLFHYIMEGRVLSRYGSNPFTSAPSAFPQDELLRFSNWKTYPSPYGPFWVLLAGALTFVAGNSLIVNVLLFKLVSLLAYVTTAAFIWRARRAAGARALPATMLWLWHPLVLIELVGNGHNDTLMLALLAIGYYCQVRGWARAALLAVGAAAMVKYAALPFLPLLLWHQLRALHRWSDRARAVLRTTWPVLTVMAAALAPFWVGARTLGFLREAGQFYASLPHLARTVLKQVVSKHLANDLVSLGARGLLLGGYGLLLGRTTAAWESYLRSAFWLTILMLATWSFFVPWYVAWLVFAAAAAGTVRAGWQVLWVGLAAELSYILQFYLPARRLGVPLEQRSALTALAVFVPFAIALFPWGAPRRALRWLRSRRGQPATVVPKSAAD